MLTRRSFLTGLIAAPAIVCAGNLMPIRALPAWYEDTYWMTDTGLWVLRRVVRNGFEISKVEHLQDQATTLLQVVPIHDLPGF